MDYIRSCYTTDMRFKTGASPVSVQWFFCPTGAKFFTARHRYASLNNVPGDYVDDGSIGEVPGAVRSWRNGSLPAPYDGQRIGGSTADFFNGCTNGALPWAGSPAMPVACMLTPTPPCLSGPYPNYDRVDISFDNGFSWNALSQTSGDSWGAQFGVDSILWSTTTQCGGITPTVQALSIAQVSNPLNVAVYNPSAYSPTYPATWTYTTIYGHPAGWVRGKVLLRTRCSGSLRSSGYASGLNASSLSIASLPFLKVGDSLIAVLFQFTETGVFGPLPTPVISSGYAPVHTPADKQMSVWLLPNYAGGTPVTVSGLGANALQDLYLIAVVTPPAAAVRGSVFLDNQAGALTLSPGSVSFTGDDTSVIGFFGQYRLAIGSTPQPNFSSIGGGFVLESEHSRSQSDGGSGFYKLHDAWVLRGPVPAGSYSPSATTTVANTWSAGGIAVR